MARRSTTPPRGRGRRSALIVVGAVVVVALGLGALALFVVKLPALSADGALNQYAATVASGDLAQADRLVPAPSGRARPVSGAVLADAANRVSVVTTSIVSNSGSSATGRVTFELAGQRHTATLKLARGASQLGVLPNWRVTTPWTTLIHLKVPAPGTASLNGVSTPLAADLTLTVYPGRYAVGLAADNTWFTSTTVTVNAATSGATAAPQVSPTAKLGDEALAQVTKAIDACVATAVPMPAGCPFTEPAVGSLAGFSWHLDRYPTIAFLDPTHVFLQGGQVTANFVLTYSYIVNKQESDPIAIKGTGALTFPGSSVAVAIAAG